ncbi:MAG: SHOCT domain-containing protein, partial [Candidatus Bathyarchaeota archaeon]
LRWGQFNSILPKEDLITLLENAVEQSIFYSQNTFDQASDTTQAPDEPLSHVTPPKEILDNFEPGEILLEIIETYSLKNTPEWLALTDRRVMYLDKKLLGRYEFHAIPYMKMQNAIAKIGRMIWGEFIIQGEGDTIIHLKRLKKEGIISSFETMKKAINAIAIEPLSIIHKKGLFGEEWTLSKPPEMIMRQQSEEVDIFNILKQRLAKGEITKEEYSEMKNLLEVQ